MNGWIKLILLITDDNSKSDDNFVAVGIKTEFNDEDEYSEFTGKF